MRSFLVVSALLLTFSSAVEAQSRMTPMKVHEPSSFISQAMASPQCEDGVVYDDGTVENGITFDTAILDLVQRFDGVGGQMVDQICICWTRLPGQEDLDFDFVFYEADGPNGQPGTFIDFFTATAEQIPEFPDVGLFTYDFSAQNFVLPPSGDIYIGASWEALGVDIFLCTDENGGGTQPVFASGDLGQNWNDVRDPSIDPDLDALIIRGDFTPVTSQCVEDANTLCLAEDRFQVQVDWATPQGDSGQGMAVELTADTGYFWFFNEENVEMVIKVLDACSFADRFWVFAGGLTNVEVDITVTDTQTGTVQTYTNPLGTPFQPIQDTNAFATCP